MALTTKRNYITSDGYDTAIPIYPVTTENLKQWLKELPAEQARWAKANHFKGEKGDSLKLSDHDGEIKAIAVGLGDKAEISDPWAYAALAKNLPEGHYRIEGDHNPAQAAIGWSLAQYQFDRYLRKKNRNKAILVVKDTARLTEIKSVINGLIQVRDLVNTPTCDMGPSHLSATTQALAERHDADFREIVGEGLLEKGFNSIHAVGRAATNQPRLLDMIWGREGAPKITLVGKGVCFDTGGLDLKPSSGMRIMKKDMGGAAHALGLARMIMESGLDIRLRLLIPAVENNLAGNAFRPGDIIKSYHGTTIEVDNTDAEGRLVLCDALALASEDDPELLLDFATLTGAARVAMGTDIVPFFTGGDHIAVELANFSIRENDPLWRMPLYEEYTSQLKSNHADMSNMGSGPYGGAIMAALFLKHFVKRPENWVHFDVFAWNMNDRAGRPQGGEAMALRAVFSYLRDRFCK